MRALFNTDNHEKNHALLVNDAQQYALSVCTQFGLSKCRAADEAAHLAAVVGSWRERVARCGVMQSDRASYAEQIDRPFLRAQRQEFAKRI